MNQQVYRQVEEFYDGSSPLWSQIYGEHIHHGYYGRDGKYKIERHQAQVELIEELLSWSGIKIDNAPQNILDVGCGIGGSSIYLADKFATDVTGINLSEIQLSQAREKAIRVSLETKTNFQLANALEMPFADNSFDLVWSLESAEYMPDKNQFLAECYRVLQPGGKLVLATWCHRETSVTGDLTESERVRLKEIYRTYNLPYVVALSKYKAIASSCGFQAIKTDDWSTSVAPFWHSVLDNTWDFNAITNLVTAGWKTLESALSFGLMSQGYRQGLLNYGLLCATKE